MENKNLYDIIFLTDKELGIDSGKENGRPCVVVGVDFIEESGAYVVPLSSKGDLYGDYQQQLRLSTGSYLNLNNKPIHISWNKFYYAELSSKYLTDEEIDEIEFRYGSYEMD